MRECTIKLNEIEKIQEFVRLASASICDIDVYSGKYVVDGKSLLGVLSLCGTTLKIVVNADDMADVDSFMSNIEKFK